MKKKIIAMSLALVVVAGVGNGIVAKAETYTQNGTNAGSWTSSDDDSNEVGTNITTDNNVKSEKNVTITTGASLEVYSVDISWGDMAIEDTASEWDPDTHTYDNVNTAKFGDGATDGKVTVTNHSNVGITSTCSFAYTAGKETQVDGKNVYRDTTYSNSTLEVKVDNATSSYPIISAEGVDYAQTTKTWASAGIQKEHSLIVEGNLNSKTPVTVDDNLVVGTTTITLKKTL